MIHLIELIFVKYFRAHIVYFRVGLSPRVPLQAHTPARRRTTENKTTS